MTRQTKTTKSVVRCDWVGDDALYQKYHDKEWGVPQKKDQALFEKLVLEGFQAGLSWITVLRKREHFRKVFDEFDAEKMQRRSRFFFGVRLLTFIALLMTSPASLLILIFFVTATAVMEMLWVCRIMATMAGITNQRSFRSKGRCCGLHKEMVHNIQV